MRYCILTVIAALALTACHVANSTKSSSPDVGSVNSVIDIEAAKQLAFKEVYDRHPTRALIDAVDAEWRGSFPSVYDIHVEMTGSPEARAIYDVVVTEGEDGNLAVTEFTKVQ